MTSPAKPDERDQTDAISEAHLPLSALGPQSKLCGFRDFVNVVDKFIATSRFGRLFHLSGSGHVCSVVTELQSINTLSNLFDSEKRDSRNKLLQGSPGWADHICNNGIHNRCECQSPLSSAIITVFTNITLGIRSLTNRRDLRVQSFQ